MKGMFQGSGCQVNEAGISMSGNPLSQAVDAVTGRPLVQGPMGGPMPAMGSSEMLGPMARGGGLEGAWGEAGPAGLGDAMGAQLHQHMRPPAMGPQAGFFAAGPSAAGGSWAQEFAGPGVRPAGPGNWAAEFASGPAMAGPATAPAMQAPQMMGPGMMGPGMMMPPMMGPGMMAPQMMGPGPQAMPTMAPQPAAAQVEAAPEAADAVEKSLDMEEAFKQALGGLELEGEDPMEAMAELMRLAGEEGELSAFENAWSQSLDKPSVYEFQADNKFLQESDPMAEALRLIREGRDREAILALEAEVQKHVDSSEGWRLMGQLYADFDQDVEAIQCLRRGHEADPYNLDSLLALGVSCVNELDQLPALRYMRQWIENHEDHSTLIQGLEPPAAYDFEAWRQQVTHLFKQAAARSPHDCDAFVALGVMENINRNYDGAVQAFATACRLRPNDRTCWNKLGATLANSGQSEKAVIAYHQGLQLKPNYCRSWSNLAIAHTNLNQHADAARFYLSALRLNPDATHLWRYVSSSVHRMDGGDDPSRLAALMPAVSSQDLSACSQMVDGVLDPNALPKAQETLSVPVNDTLASMGL